MAQAQYKLPELRREHIELIPEFSGQPEIFHRFLEISEKLVKRFANIEDPSDFQNEMLLSSILSKIKGPAARIVHSSSFSNWCELREALINSYSDKRDGVTIGLELAQLRQTNETPFQFFEKIQRLLNLQVAYFRSHTSAVEAETLIKYSRAFALRVLLKGLKDPIGSLMRARNPEDLNSAMNLLTNDFQYHGYNVNFFSHSNHKQFKQVQPQRPIFKPDNNNYQHFTRQTPRFPQNQNHPSTFQNRQSVSTQPTYKPTPMSVSTVHNKPHFNNYNMDCNETPEDNTVPQDSSFLETGPVNNQSP